MEYSSKWNTHQNGILIKMEYSSKWNTPIIIKMEHSYQKGTLISKWNTHQNGILIKKEHSSKRNTHQKGTLIKKEHSSKRNTHQKWNSYSSWNENPHIKSIVGNLKRSNTSSQISSLSGMSSMHNKGPTQEFAGVSSGSKSIVGNLRQSRNPPSVAVACLACRLGRASHPPIPCQ